ncbi:MAG TPA: hypothetical protein VJZ00_08605 [Thermoanaerobaculia bacterium]|nr:hypothetical protein [Thermoanaerobaculia bacterium]
MKKAVIALTLVSLFAFASGSQAARVVRVRTRNAHVTRVRVNVVRPAPVVRVAPRVYLGPVTFREVRVATLPATVWTSSENLNRREGWTEFVMNVDKRGTRLLLDIDRGAAQISYAEVVFENGEAQVVDFNDSVHRTGIYSLLDFADGRKVDHVKVVAKADSGDAIIRLHLVS